MRWHVKKKTVYIQNMYVHITYIFLSKNNQNLIMLDGTCCGFGACTYVDIYVDVYIRENNISIEIPLLRE